MGDCFWCASGAAIGGGLFKTGVLKNFAKSRKTPVSESLFLGLRPGTLLKKRLRYWRFLANFAIFLRTPNL